MKKSIFLLMLVCALEFTSEAHEPLYGFGPHVLFKNGFAPHLTLQWNQNRFESEYALGYGLTRNWTVIGELPWSVENNRYRISGPGLKSKYRFWLRADKGISYQASLITRLETPLRSGEGSLLSMAVTTGREALHLYWFASAGYALRTRAGSDAPGNRLIYNFSIGYRPFKVNYYKPDIVFFLESAGRFFSKSSENGQTVEESGGGNFALAPSFFLTYRNFAVRGGVQYGILNGAFVPKIEKNFKLTIEMHI